MTPSHRAYIDNLFIIDAGQDADGVITGSCILLAESIYTAV